MARRLPFGRTGAASSADLDDGGDLDPVPAWSPEPAAAPFPPSRMQGREPAYGYATAAVIVAGAALNLILKTGKGAPLHPTLWPSYVAIVLAVALAVTTFRFRSRLVSPFVAIFGGMFDTLARGPNRLEYPHLVVIFVAFGFAVALTMRQRREQKALGITPGRRGARGGAGGRGAAATADDGLKKPPPSKRYTPPKYATKPPPARGRPRR